MSNANAMVGTRGARPPGRARSEQLQRLLSQQDRTLRALKETLRESLSASQDVTDVEEQSADIEDLSVRLAVLELSSRTVQGIEAALRRLGAGRYATCAVCGSGIAPVRLRALPFADLCRGCQEKHDTVWASGGRRTTTLSEASLMESLLTPSFGLSAVRHATRMQVAPKGTGSWSGRIHEPAEC
jgi:DnaK suppressor protein